MYKLTNYLKSDGTCMLPSVLSFDLLFKIFLITFVPVADSFTLRIFIRIIWTFECIKNYCNCFPFFSLTLKNYAYLPLIPNPSSTNFKLHVSIRCFICICPCLFNYFSDIEIQKIELGTGWFYEVSSFEKKAKKQGRLL